MGWFMPKGKWLGVEKDMQGQDVYDAARREFRQLAINVRVINALVAGGISSINDLHALSESELEQLPGIGPKTVKVLKTYLRRQSFSLSGNDNHLMSVKFGTDALAEIDKWALQQKGVVSRAEAIRRLVEMGLTRIRN